MRLFALLDFQYTMLLIFLGLLASVLLLVAFGGNVLFRGSQQEKKEAEEYPEGLRVQNRPIPLILIVVYVGWIVWAVAYVVMIGIRGEPF